MLRRSLLPFYRSSRRWAPIVDCVATASTSSATKEPEPRSVATAKSSTTPNLVPVSKPAIDSQVPIEIQSPIRGMTTNKFDATSIMYPQIEDIDQLHALKEFASMCQNAITERFDVDKMWKDRSRPEDALQELQNLGINGCIIPKEYGGLGLDKKNWVYINDVIGGRDLSLWANVTTQNDFGAMIIAKYGTDEQRQKYLPLIAQNKLNIAYALQEPECGYDISQMRTSVTSTSGGIYGDMELRGVKTRVPNAQNADLFLVWANVGNVDLASANVKDQDLASVLHNVMIVEVTPENRDKIKVGERNHTPGLPGVEFHTVEFDGVKLDGRTDILGDDAGAGFEVAMQLFENSSLSFAAAIVGCCRNLIREYVEFANRATRYETILSNVAAIRTKITELSTAMFGVESLTYYTAGHLDESASKVMDLEHLVLQVEAQKLLRKVVLSSIELIGADSLGKMDSKYDRLMKDALTLSSTTLYVSEDFAVNGIAMGMLGAWADANMSSMLKKRQNPHSFWYNIKHEMTSQRDFAAPKLSLHIHENVHPSLADAAAMFERQMKRTEVTINQLIIDDGQMVEHHHEQLARLATVASCLSTMVASIARASRSYALGIEHGENETQIAMMICMNKSREIEVALREMFDEDSSTFAKDFLSDKIAEYQLDRNTYAYLSPLEKNW